MLEMEKFHVEWHFDMQLCKHTRKFDHNEHLHHNARLDPYTCRIIIDKRVPVPRLDSLAFGDDGVRGSESANHRVNPPCVEK